VNGTLDKSYAGVALPDNIDTNALHLGRGDKYGDHTMDEMALYSTPLTPGRVGAHFDAGKQGCADIAEATNSTYQLEPADVGARIKVKVTATNSAGGVSAASAATEVVETTSLALSAPSTPTWDGMAAWADGARKRIKRARPKRHLG